MKASRKTTRLSRCGAGLAVVASVMNRKTLLLLIAAMQLSGCAMTWDKAGATQQDFQRDRYECDRDAAQSHREGFGALALKIECLEAHGWTRV